MSDHAGLLGSSQPSPPPRTRLCRICVMGQDMLRSQDVLSSKASHYLASVLPSHHLIFTRLISLSPGPCAHLPCIIHSQVVPQTEKQ